MYHPIDRTAHATAFVTPVMEHGLEWKIAQWVHHEDINATDSSTVNVKKKKKKKCIWTFIAGIREPSICKFLITGKASSKYSYTHLHSAMEV